MMKKLPPRLHSAVYILLGLWLSTTALASETVTVSIEKFQFIPQEITIKPGTTVIWVNNEKRQYHSVWFESQGDPEPDYFFPEETYERHFDKEGSFDYHCGPHPKMTGVVHVKK